jgi:hypothetical protein
MTSAALGVQTIGAALAQARGLFPKHAVKQVVRLLSNTGIDVWEVFSQWVTYVVGAREDGAIVKSGVQALNQAAAWLMFVTSIPSLNFTPVITLAR